MEEFLVRAVEDRICTLTLNRPEVLNSLNYELFQQLENALTAIAEDGDDIACVILRGNGKAFSAGHDLKAIESGVAAEHADFEAATLEKLASLPQPVIAEVQGYCFTGALELALACDLIFIDTDTQLADTHSKWGLSPVWGMTQRLPRRIGVSRAKDLMYSSRLVAADEALHMGLVDRVVQRALCRRKFSSMLLSWHRIRATHNVSASKFSRLPMACEYMMVLIMNTPIARACAQICRRALSSSGVESLPCPAGV